MTQELAIIPPVPEEDLFEKAATVYLDLWDQQGKPPSIRGDVEPLLGEYPSDWLCKLHGRAFEEYLAKRRKEHILYTMAPRLVGAHMGAEVGQLALTELVRRLRDPEGVKRVSTKDLTSLVKRAFELAGLVDKDLGDLGGDKKPQVYIDMRTLIATGDEARAADILMQVARRFSQREGLDAGNVVSSS